MNYYLKQAIHYSKKLLLAIQATLEVVYVIAEAGKALQAISTGLQALVEVEQAPGAIIAGFQAVKEHVEVVAGLLYGPGGYLSKLLNLLGE